MVSSPLCGSECVGKGAGWVEDRQETADFSDCDRAGGSSMLRRASRVRTNPAVTSPKEAAVAQAKSYSHSPNPRPGRYPMPRLGGHVR